MTEVPMYTINRQCSSGLQAVATVAQSIKAGTIDVGLAGGVESMSTYPMACAYDQKKLSPNVMKNVMAKACILSMGITSENVAEKYNISRETQDKFAEALAPNKFDQASKSVIKNILLRIIQQFNRPPGRPSPLRSPRPRIFVILGSCGAACFEVQGTW